MDESMDAGEGLPEDGVTETVVVFVGDFFVEIDWHGRVFSSQSFSHLRLVCIRNHHPCTKLTLSPIKVCTRPSNPNKRHCLLQSRQCSSQSALRDYILIFALFISLPVVETRVVTPACFLIVMGKRFATTSNL